VLTIPVVTLRRTSFCRLSFFTDGASVVDFFEFFG